MSVNEIIMSVLNTKDIPLKMLKSVIVRYESIECRSDMEGFYTEMKPIVEIEFWNE